MTSVATPWFAWAWRCGLLLAAGSAAASSAGASPPADAQADRICTLGPAWAKPEPRPLPGCAQAVCTAAGDQLLCACATGSSWQYQHRKGTQVLQRWRTEVSPMSGAAAFELRLADIAGDGRPRWLLARLLGVSNGLGVSTHELCVVDPSTPATAPQCRVVQEWQALTILVQEQGRKGCSLMDSAWQSGREASRGPGTYAVGRLWRWQDEQWLAVPALQRQAVARRLLPAFLDQRAALPQTQSAATTLWYQHSTAQGATCPGPLCPLPPSAR